MKTYLIGLSLIVFLFLGVGKVAFAKECYLEWDKIYFKDVIGNSEYNFKTNKMELQYKTYKYFQGDFPQKVSLNIPYKGDCSKLKVNEVNVFRKVGPRSFSGGEEDHSKHALTPRNISYESKPFERVSPKVDIEKGVVSLKSFRIYEALSTLDFKKDHAWELKYEILYKSNDGIDNKRVHEVELKLTH